MQNRLFTLGAMIALLLLGNGCGKDTHQSLADESMPVMRDMVATISTIKDEASAKAAKPKLEEIARKLKSIEERRRKLPMPTEAEFTAMMEKHGKEMEELQMKMIPAMMAVQFDPKINEVLKDVDLKVK